MVQYQGVGRGKVANSQNFAVFARTARSSMGRKEEGIQAQNNREKMHELYAQGVSDVCTGSQGPSAAGTAQRSSQSI